MGTHLTVLKKVSSPNYLSDLEACSIMRMNEAGVLNKLLIPFTGDGGKCNLTPKKGNEELSAISLKGLTGAFIILFIGSVLSLISFVLERPCF